MYYLYAETYSECSIGTKKYIEIWKLESEYSYSPLQYYYGLWAWTGRKFRSLLFFYVETYSECFIGTKKYTEIWKLESE